MKRAVRRRDGKPQLVDLILARRSPTSGPLALVFWWHAAGRAYETGDLEPLAKLLRSGAPLLPQVPLMIADVFDSCKLMIRDVRGGAVRFGGARRAAPDVRRAQTVRRAIRQRSTYRNCG